MVKFRRMLLVCIVASLCMLMTAVAQDAPPAGRGAAPAGRGMMEMFGGGGSGITSPEIADDNKVTFRLLAPDANSVSVNSNWSGLTSSAGTGNTSVEMTKDDQGIWSVTVGPLESEIYTYTFIVDSARVWDPENMNIMRNLNTITSTFVIPGDRGDLYAIRDVPHGALTKLWYESPTLNMRRHMYVYTPPGYYDGDEKYPVLYLLHGAGGDEDAWTSVGRAPQIMDNLIAQSKAKQMIVVMTNGNANQASSPEARPAGQRDAGRGGMMGMMARGAAPGGARRGGGGIMGGGFPDSVAKDVVTFIEKNFRVLTDKSNRAIAGFSMGGGHTISVTLSNPTMFDYIGVFSGAVFGINEEQFDALAAENPKLYWIGCGEDDSLVINGVRNLVETVKSKGFNYEYLETSGGHTWNNWRDYLSIYAQKLFK